MEGTATIRWQVREDGRIRLQFAQPVFSQIAGPQGRELAGVEWHDVPMVDMDGEPYTVPEAPEEIAQ